MGGGTTGTGEGERDRLGNHPRGKGGKLEKREM